MRYTAPKDVTGITLSTGPLAASNGTIDAPDDLGTGDRIALATAGFVATDTASVAAVAAAPVADPTSAAPDTSKAKAKADSTPDATA